MTGLTSERTKVLCAMSSGVDSSLSAMLLQEKGFEVIGATMQLFDLPGTDDHPEDDLVSGSTVRQQRRRSCAAAMASDAAAVAEKLGIKHYIFDLRTEFRHSVMDYFTNSYLKGQTPNPCIACNRYMKFSLLLQKAQELGADYIATGHYARVVRSGPFDRLTLQRAADLHKDQTYVLYNLTQNQLAKTIFPLADYTKEEVRKMAADRGLRSANRPESQEICFIPDDDYRRFLRERVAADRIRPGNFVDCQGNVLGEHPGIAWYTIGQRKGLGAFGKKLYVVDIDPQRNEVILGDNSQVFGNSLLADKLNWLLIPELDSPVRVEAQIRYNARPAKAILIPESADCVRVEFAEPQRAITPGQSVVFYQDDLLVGGGTIVKRISN